MNEILQLRGTFQQRPSPGRPGQAGFPVNKEAVTDTHLKALIAKLEELRTYWEETTLLSGALIDVQYRSVIAKSNRVSSLLSIGSMHPNVNVVGARFIGIEKKKHVITHYVSDEILIESINRLTKAKKIVQDSFDGAISGKALKDIGLVNVNFQDYGISKSVFCATVADSYYIEDFKVPDNSASADKQSLITVYKTDEDLSVLMNAIGIHLRSEKIIGDTTMLLRPAEIEMLKNSAPYLIAMSTEDIARLSLSDVIASDGEHVMSIDSPSNEPIIGVIDTVFDDRVYFSEWVQAENMVDENIPSDPSDDHGTAVSSIIVDGPAINPDLDDGCGRFRVRHFGVAAGGQYSSFTIMRNIQQIIEDNRDIKVWNLSLGSTKEVNLNSISPEAAILDEIQHKYSDILFIVAGTNKNNDESVVRIGSPADSINSIVVNATTKAGDPASYTREGVVLSFFNKPDVSSYGGDRKSDEYIRVCTANGQSFRDGTSFAAPWIARKAAYLMDVLGISREVAKAMIVDAAAGWSDTGNNQDLAPLIGHGVVPRHIDNIINSSDDEIKFIISNVTNLYESYTYGLPVPMDNERFPFVAKATLCYFPQCSINQGVDYTDTELDVYIGRVNSTGIKSINKNVQSVTDGERHYISEPEARKLFRKWDNTKHIQESIGSRTMPRKAYENGMWGISIKSKTRYGAIDRVGIRFGLVVTLKEINGANRINEFIRQCELRGWLVSRVNVESRVDVYNRAEETITFDS